LLGQNIQVEVLFEWKHEGRVVSVSGSWNNWGEKTAMTKIGHSWKGSVYLSPGKYAYKYVVDDRWCYDVEKPTEGDTATGTTNNVVNVEDYFESLTTEKSKNRDQIYNEIQESFESEKSKIQQKHQQIIEAYDKQVKALQQDQIDLKNEINNQKNQWEYRLNTAQHEIELYKKASDEKRATIEGDVRQKYDTLVNSLHNEIWVLKSELKDVRENANSKKYDNEGPISPNSKKNGNEGLMSPNSKKYENEGPTSPNSKKNENEGPMSPNKLNSSSTNQ